MLALDEALDTIDEMLDDEALAREEAELKLDLASEEAKPIWFKAQS